ncbi:AAA family ATPase [Citrobacter portucalensis]|uniref:AAA family ATPase n=2 Tax=Citrobacter portucalensis TaxID=1639133 RepID=UPI00226B4DFF|nr:AAA family ATPase [Citrobacter portucalensis]MCX8994697.1 AAA family ATPase [Citrobacter portucalensis]
MSIAGIRSNRGDGYQTLVAFDWALTVLSEQDFQWLEVDSISYSVDDVVVGKVDGTLIACQCKKNQTDFKAWTIADLGDELDKAFLLQVKNPKVNVRFYSRNNFGDLAKLKEHCSSQPDESSYLLSLGKAQQILDKILAKQLAKTAPGLSTFEFLHRTNFVTSDDLDQMELQLRIRLRQMVSNPAAAFNALWVSLDKLGARMGDGGLSTAVQHRLTKKDLRTIVQQAGATLVPLMDLTKLHHTFASTSAIGRSWRRDIAGQRIANPVLDELLVAIDARKSSILLTGLPGSGKTCVLLELQEVLEERAKNRSDIVPLFIQSREFADLVTSEDRQAQGLSPLWVEESARLAENSHVIIIIDSLDVLSIAREHLVLKYFLAQIDRVLLVPNITVVTACRDFDRYYDRRIAARHWDCELKCQLLDWDAEIAPLLYSLGVATTNIDAVTRKLIRNPRELALFVELALRDGSFNVVTSQALAQRYLNTIVLAESELGDIAIQAIETIASEMLHSRSLVVPNQRFPASQDIQRKLLSLNVLQKTQDGKLTFGHQTLLDVLAISQAIRNGTTLSEFINALPPVPFVRPSIRSFIAQLAQGERREFRKQLRTVLTGNSAFHIRRLVAESFAEQNPQNEDWSLIRDLREKNRDVFQVIYTTGSAIQWHHFWINFLIPYLKIAQDVEGIEMHVHRIAQWNNIDTAGVVSFWIEVLDLDWFDVNKIADQLAMHMSQIKSENISIAAPLLERLLALPQSEHSFLGQIIADCVLSGVINDALLWRYITADVNEEDLLQYKLDNKLRCQAHEFGNRNDNFLQQRMLQSSVLLDHALESIEYWSLVQASRFGDIRKGYRHGFLGETSFEDTHSHRDMKHAGSMNILLDAVEVSILQHAKTNSDWWQKNRERICFSNEGALFYFGIIACTKFPETNIDVVGSILCDREILESELTYELGGLIQSAFNLLSTPAQDAVVATILTLHDEYIFNECPLWRLKAQAELIVPIPSNLRSPELQILVDEYERKAGVLIRQPYIHSQGGIVSAPFSSEVFLSISNSGVLQLLLHYDGHTQRDWDDFLIGGEREVGWQLREASSRQPTRFLSFLSDYWATIPSKFRDDIMNGVATYMAHRYGNLNANATWEPLEEPNALILVNQILDELERHPMQWRCNYSSAKSIEACANVIKDPKAAERLIFLAIGFAELDKFDQIEGDSVDLITKGINMEKGNIAEALMILASNFLEQGHELPNLLTPTLRRFASDEHPAIRALILRRLPYLQSKSFGLGWELFHLAMHDTDRLWQTAERCMYYAYHSHFEIVKLLLARLHREGIGKDLETWGRISSLAVMTGHIDFDEFIRDLNTLNSAEAWHGAATVWVNAENIKRHRDMCLAGINAGLHADNIHALEVAGRLDHIFTNNNGAIRVPIELVAQCFSVFEKDSVGKNKHHRLFRFHEWLNAISQQDPEQALSLAEIYLTYIKRSKQYLYDHNDNLTQLMTRLFAEAEEQEESDHGAILQRVVALQDTMLSLGVNGVADWLKAAERP